MGVAKVEGVDDLDEDTLDQLVVSEEGEPPDDGVETTRTEVIDEEDVTARSISRWKVRNSLMALCLAGYVVSLLYALDGIASVCSRTQNMCRKHGRRRRKNPHPVSPRLDLVPYYDRSTNVHTVPLLVTSGSDFDDTNIVGAQ